MSLSEAQLPGAIRHPPWLLYQPINRRKSEEVTSIETALIKIKIHAITSTNVLQVIIIVGVYNTVLYKYLKFIVRFAQ